MQFIIFLMLDAIYLTSLLVSIIVLVALKTHSAIIYDAIDGQPLRIMYSSPKEGAFGSRERIVMGSSTMNTIRNAGSDNAGRGLFSVIIVTYNEILLEQTYGFDPFVMARVKNVLENTEPGYIYEVVLVTLA